jgi:hypothetical protein
MEKLVNAHRQQHPNPLSLKNDNVHFYIRKFLDKSGCARQKQNFLAPFSARREHVNACSRKFNWSVSTPSSANAARAQHVQHN